MLLNPEAGMEFRENLVVIDLLKVIQKGKVWQNLKKMN
jgi:hypothetical protein